MKLPAILQILPFTGKTRFAAPVLAAFVLAACSLGFLEMSVPALPQQTVEEVLAAKPRHHPDQLENVGFFTPRGIQPELAGRTAFGMFNLWGMEQVQQGLAVAEATGYRVLIDFGPAITRPKSRADLSMSYTDLRGQLGTKVLEPLDQPKVLEFLPNWEIQSLIGPVLDRIAQSPIGVETIFVADEPYLNGISRSEMERVGELLRKMLNSRGLGRVKLGVLFSSAMFDPAYAGMVSDDHSEYVKNIDTYIEQARQSGSIEALNHASMLKTHRLTTYDKAGNLYTEGGIPQGYKVVGFDFYLSTQLLDFVHNRSLQWFAAHTSVPACQEFAGKTVKDIRSKLSFFKPGAYEDVGSTAEARARDKELLDKMFECRNGGILERLQLAAERVGRQTEQPGQASGVQSEGDQASAAIEIMLVSESSNNGVLEFGPNGEIESDQPADLIEGRVLDEVNRAIRFYEANKQTLAGGVMFFTFDSEYDDTIQLKIGGASSMPSVVSEILTYTGAGAQTEPQAVWSLPAQQPTKTLAQLPPPTPAQPKPRLQTLTNSERESGVQSVTNSERASGVQSVKHSERASGSQSVTHSQFASRSRSLSVSPQPTDTHARLQSILSAPANKQ